VTNAFINVAASSGHALNNDYNGEDQHGVAYGQSTCFFDGPHKGQRCSTAMAYIHSVTRSNLVLITHAAVTKLNIVDTLRVVGASYTKDSLSHDILAAREVILCAGAIDSPKLMLLSGIGPADELRKVGIKCRHNLPGVGKGLTDHTMTRVLYSCTDKSAGPGTSASFLCRAIAQSGPQGLFNVSVAQAHLFFKSELHDGPGPDIQIIFIPGQFSMHGKDPISHGFSFLVVPTQPKSRGGVTLRSANPLDPPRIDPRYITDEDDFKTIKRGVEEALRMGAHEDFATFGAKLDIGEYDLASQVGMRKFIREASQTIWHPCSTCRMGVDSMAVVDPKLRVFGMEGLRIADASIMPMISSGNTNLPSIMIGEKAAHLILADRKA